MEFIQNYLVPILELIVLTIELFLFLKPSENTVTIDHSNRYYFNTTYYQSKQLLSNSNSDNSTEMFFAFLAIFSSYIFYSLFQQYIILIIMVLGLIKILKYRYLKISAKTELILPVILGCLFFTLNFLPDNIKSFWQTNAKIDLTQTITLSVLINNFTEQLTDIANLFFHWENSYIRNMSILGTTLLTFITLYYLLTDIFTPKNKLRITTNKDIINKLIPVIFVYSLVFFHISWNPIRLLWDALVHFLSH